MYVGVGPERARVVGAAARHPLAGAAPAAAERGARALRAGAGGARAHLQQGALRRARLPPAAAPRALRRYRPPLASY